MHHDAHGYWLREAGAAGPAAPPAAGDLRADVVVLGGGYTGMWTAWQLLERAPDTSVVLLEADVCGHGPSGRNGGFCETLWTALPSLRERFGDARALEACEASSGSVQAIGDWCEAEGVDAWFRRSGYVMASTAAAHDAVLDRILAAGAPQGRIVALDGAAVRARCDAPAFRRGLLVPGDATVQPARLALGLRRRLLERGVRIHERTRVTRVGERVETDGGSVAAGATVLAVNTATAGFPGFARALAVASSHIVLTEPVPAVLEELGWTGGEAISDARTLPPAVEATTSEPDTRSATTRECSWITSSSRDRRPSASRAGCTVAAVASARPPRKTGEAQTSRTSSRESRRYSSGGAVTGSQAPSCAGVVATSSCGAARYHASTSCASHQAPSAPTASAEACPTASARSRPNRSSSTVSWSQRELTKPPFRPLGPWPHTSRSSTTTSAPASAACQAVQRPR